MPLVHSLRSSIVLSSISQCCRCCCCLRLTEKFKLKCSKLNSSDSVAVSISVWLPAKISVRACVWESVEDDWPVASVFFALVLALAFAHALALYSIVVLFGTVLLLCHSPALILNFVALLRKIYRFAECVLLCRLSLDPQRCSLLHTHTHAHICTFNLWGVRVLWPTAKWPRCVGHRSVSGRERGDTLLLFFSRSNCIWYAPGVFFICLL